MQVVLGLYHAMLIALSMAQLHLLAQYDQNEVQHDFFGHVMSFMPTVASMAPLCF